MDWDGVGRAADALAKRGAAPDIAVILGSGLGGVAEAVAGEAIPYADIPGFPTPDVPTHSGALYLGTLGGARVAVLSGRTHCYEGASPGTAALPVAALAAIGARTLIVTNAAGGIEESLYPGDLVLIEDHISLAGLAGLDPMRGSAGPDGRGRFTGLTEAYSERLLRLAEEEGAAMGLSLTRGVYGFAAGPSFETPAEVRALRTLGADLVGMSTVPEVIAAKASGLDVLGVSLVTNRAAARRIPHKNAAEANGHLGEIWAAADRAAPVLGKLVTRILARMAAS